MSGRGKAPGLSEPGQGAERGEAVVPKALDGERLDKALAALMPGLSRTRARKVIGMGGAWIGQSRVRVASRKVFAGDRLTATWHEAAKEAERFPLRVVHEDARVVVVDKPAGQLVQGTELGDVGSLQRALEKRFGPETRLMHRLDKPASGLLVAARDKGASAHLTPQLREHEMDRRYLAAAGAAPPEGPCELRLRRDGRNMRVAGEGEDGMDARTDFRVVTRDGERALLEVRLHTGRTHQIRVHAQALGAPLLGDRKYGGPPADRLCLHAWRLVIRHPDGDREMVFEAPPGPDFWAAAGIEETTWSSTR